MFNIGDKVECVKSFHPYLIVGKIYTVGGKYHDPPDTLGILDTENGEDGWTWPNNKLEFKLISIKQYQPNYNGSGYISPRQGYNPPPPVNNGSLGQPFASAASALDALYANSYFVDSASYANWSPKVEKIDSHKCTFKLYTGLFEMYDMCFECGKKK